jgi:molybdopterin/thiamine biosynthesis adenylyltransferase/proteasome lid subunit RPN8/RPN11
MPSDIREMLIEADVLTQIQATIGNLAPETGGMLGGDSTGRITHYYFDGTAKRTGVTYSPDVERINRVIQEEWRPAGIELLGFVHSHPSGITQLSCGDVQYADAILRALPRLKQLFLPIAQARVDNRTFELHGYVAVRQDDNIRIDRVSTNVVDAHRVDRQGLFADLHIFERVRDAYDLEYLERCRIVAIGCGGSAGFLEDMARTGVGEFVLIDPDVVAETNLATQQTFRKDVGRSKVSAIAERIRAVNDLACAVAYSCSLDEIDDVEFSYLCTTKLREAIPKVTLLCGMTDNFFVQARVNRLALNFGLPSLCAQVYRQGVGAEVTFTHPELTPACHRCRLRSRYDAYARGFKNDVGSQAAPYYATARLNALKQFVTLALLHHGAGHGGWNKVLTQISTRNLVQLRLAPDCQLPAFAGLLHEPVASRLFCDDAVWIGADSEDWTGCPDCGGRGELLSSLGRFADTRRHIDGPIVTAPR